MRVKFTIAVCALLMLGLVVSQANAQGFSVSKAENSVVEHGRNQRMGALRLDYTDSGGNIDAGSKITVSYGLPITTATADFGVGGDAGDNLDCDTPITCATDAIAVAEDKMSITITLANVTGGGLTLRGVRADVSSLSAGDMIVATIS